MATDADLSADQEIVLTRVLNAPRELVWRAFTEIEHLSQWWGPQGFTITTRARDVKPGGVWSFVMHGPDGRDYENQITYLEVVAPERLVYKHGGAKDTEPVSFQVTVTFESAGANGAQTRLTMRSIFPSKNARDFVIREYNAVEGGKQTLGRLAERLEAMRVPVTAAASQPFVITRVFPVPVERMWAVWTEREHLMRWFGPKGVTIPQCSIDLRPGGIFHYCMRGPDGNDMWGRWEFVQVVPKERLEFLVSFSDEKGNVTRAPWEEKWPLLMHSVVTFAEHAGIGRGTVVRVEWTAHHATAAEQQIFDAGHDSMRQGWSGTFDALTDYLAAPAQ